MVVARCRLAMRCDCFSKQVERDLVLVGQLYRGRALVGVCLFDRLDDAGGDRIAAVVAGHLDDAQSAAGRRLFAAGAISHIVSVRPRPIVTSSSGQSLIAAPAARPNIALPRARSRSLPSFSKMVRWIPQGSSVRTSRSNATITGALSPLKGHAG